MHTFRRVLVMASDRTIINLRGYCLYCLGKIDNNNFNGTSNSPACSPLRSPLGKRHFNKHSMTDEERLAPFTVLCGYLNIDLPDCYAFGDEADTESLTLTPPLCTKCNEMSARLCFLQDELEHIQTKIRNVTKRIYQRVVNTCDRHGALKREAFDNEFRTKSKSPLSRGRGENLKTRKTTQLVKAFQVKIIEKENEIVQQSKTCGMTLISAELDAEQHNPFMPMELELENGENECKQLFPPSETLRSKPVTWNENLYLMDCQKEECNNKDPSDLTTLLCHNDTKEIGTDSDNASYNLDTKTSECKMSKFEIKTPPVDDCRVVTRSQARKLLN